MSTWTGVSKTLFFKLLNDDFLFSQLTELQYGTIAKDKVVVEAGYPCVGG